MRQSDRRLWVPSMAALFTLTFALTGWRSSLQRLSDNSFFLHLRTGRWILDHGIPREDMFSYTAPGRRWVAQSWLAELLYGALDRAFGLFAIRLLTAATGALVAALAYQLAMRLCQDRMRAVGIAVAALFASLTLWSERPLFLGVLAFVVLLWIVELPASSLGRRPLVAIPVLMWLWANVHGTFALGFAYLALHLLGGWLDGQRPWEGREGALLKASVIAGAACLLNPYGPALVLFPLDLLSRGDILQRITEWRSPDFRKVQGMAFAVWIVTLVACLSLGKRPSRRDVVVTVPFLLLGLWAQRNIAVAPLVGLPAVARAMATDRRAATDPHGRATLNRVVAGLLIAMGLMWTVEAAAQPDFDLDSYPVKAIRFVEREGLSGERVATTDKWGAYVALARWPAQKVFMDDRYDMYPTAFTQDYIDLSDGGRRWESVLDRYKVQVVVWPRDNLLARLMGADASWRRVYRDGNAVVFTRRACSTPRC